LAGRRFHANRRVAAVASKRAAQAANHAQKRSGPAGSVFARRRLFRVCYAAEVGRQVMGGRKAGAHWQNQPWTSSAAESTHGSKRTA